MELALCVATLILAITWMRGSRFGKGKVSSFSYYLLPIRTDITTIRQLPRFDV